MTYGIAITQQGQNEGPCLLVRHYDLSNAYDDFEARVDDMRKSGDILPDDQIDILLWYQDEIDSLKEYQRISYSGIGYTFRFEVI